MKVERVSAFAYKNIGGNPAGVLILDEMLSEKQMLEIAKDVNYSETAFLLKEGNSFRIRYFSPETEIAFCGHATIASGFVLGQKFGLGIYDLVLNNDKIQIKVTKNNNKIFTSINSVKTYTYDIEEDYINNIIDAFSFIKRN